VLRAQRIPVLGPGASLLTAGHPYETYGKSGSTGCVGRVEEPIKGIEIGGSQD
jgi:hypothetical protein